MKSFMVKAFRPRFSIIEVGIISMASCMFADGHWITALVLMTVSVIPVLLLQDKYVGL